MRYDKQPIDFPAQIALLKERGMIFTNEDKALEGLFSISYFRLASYWRHLEHRKSRRFKKDARFDGVLKLYAFDQQLRNIIFSAIQNIEIAFRTSYIVCSHIHCRICDNHAQPLDYPSQFLNLTD